MARLQSTQKPTTLLTLKKDKEESNDYMTVKSGEIILITEDGIVDGDVRFTKGDAGLYGGVAGTFPLYPVGSIIFYAGSEQPDGYLACNGQQVSKDLYPELFEKIRYTWGMGIHPSTGYRNTDYFRVPDFENTANIKDASNNEEWVYFMNKSSDYPDPNINNRKIINDPNKPEEHNISGLFIRNLNERGIGANIDGPDYYRLHVTKLGLWDSRLEGGNREYVERQYGPKDIQIDYFMRHRHQPTSTTTTSDGDHNHRYYGAPRSRYYVDDNGVKLDGNAYYVDRLTGEYTTSSTDASGSANPGYQKVYNNRSISDTHVAGDAGYGRKLGSYEDNSSSGYFLNFGIYSKLTPLAFNTRTTASSGAHIHFGWMGFGRNFADTLNTTNLNRSDHEHLDNARETRPKNYSVMFCIKY